MIIYTIYITNIHIICIVQNIFNGFLLTKKGAFKLLTFSTDIPDL